MILGILVENIDIYCDLKHFEFIAHLSLSCLRHQKLCIESPNFFDAKLLIMFKTLLHLELLHLFLLGLKHWKLKDWKLCISPYLRVMNTHIHTCSEAQMDSDMNDV